MFVHAAFEYVYSALEFVDPAHEFGDTKRDVDDTDHDYGANVHIVVTLRMIRAVTDLRVMMIQESGDTARRPVGNTAHA